MNTIIISAIVVALIGAVIIILWKTQGFKKLREKNRAAEIKEEKADESIVSLAERFNNQELRNQIRKELQDEIKKDIGTHKLTSTVFENGMPPNSSNYHQVVNQPVWTSEPVSFTTTATVNFAPEQIVEDPPKVRVEIRAVYDYIKDNVVDYIVLWHNDFCEFSKRSTNETKDISIINDVLYVADLDTKFKLLTSETALFNNLAKEESERRAIEASAITHEKLKKFAERLPKVEKTVGVKAVIKKTVPVKSAAKKVAKGKVK